MNNMEMVAGLRGFGEIKEVRVGNETVGFEQYRAMLKMFKLQNQEVSEMNATFVLTNGLCINLYFEKPKKAEEPEETPIAGEEVAVEKAEKSQDKKPRKTRRERAEEMNEENPNPAEAEPADKTA